jgi:hypothetical protein
VFAEEVTVVTAVSRAGKGSRVANYWDSGVSWDGSDGRRKRGRR